MNQTRFYGWKLLAILWVIIVADLAFPFYGAGLINSYMAADLHFDRRTLGLSFAIFQWVAALPGPLVALCVNRKGIRFTLALGSLLLVLGSLLMSLVVHSSLQVEIVFGGIIGAGAAAGGFVGTLSGVGHWFAKRKALAISLLLTGPYIGGFIAPPLLNWVIVKAGGNWRAAWDLISGFSLLAMVLAIFFVKEWPSDLGQFPDGEPPAMSPQVAVSGLAQVRRRGVYRTAEEWRFAEVMASPAFWLMLIATLGFSMGNTIFVSHGVAHLQDLGHSAGEAALAVSIMAVAALAGSLLVAALGDRIEPRFIWSVASCAVGVSLLLLLQATSLVEGYISAILLGAGFGACVPCEMTIASNYFGHQAYAWVVGILGAIGPTAGAIGAIGAGYVYTHFGSYSRAFYLISALSFLGSLLALLMTPPTKRTVPPMTAVAGG
jgi:MFS family permease